jgi:hypothetical protein
VLRKSFGFFCVGAPLCRLRLQIHEDAPDDIAAQGEDYLYLPRDRPRLRSSGLGGSGAVLAAPRFVAVRHKLEIVAPGSGLTKSITVQCGFGPEFHLH